MEYNVGDKVHFSIGTDTFPGTVIRASDRVVTVRQDKFHIDPEWRADFIPGGFVGHVANNDTQVNVITEDPEGAEWKFTRKSVPQAIREYNSMTAQQAAAKARFTAVGSGWQNGIRLAHGWAAHRDFNF